MKSLLAILFILSAATFGVYGLTRNDQIRAAKLVRGLIDSNNRLVPNLVRLSFHDCVGGCDGCINMNNPSNAGLNPSLNALDSVWPQVQDMGMSRADFWQLAAVVALQWASGGKALAADPQRGGGRGGGRGGQEGGQGGQGGGLGPQGGQGMPQGGVGGRRGPTPPPQGPGPQPEGPGPQPEGPQPEGPGPQPEVPLPEITAPLPEVIQPELPGPLPEGPEVIVTGTGGEAGAGAGAGGEAGAGAGAGEEEIDWADSPMDELFNNFKIGRVDCPTSPSTEEMHTFPNSHGGLEATLNSMKSILGVGTTDREIVALLGAHTLGAANPNNSGFRGPWVTDPLLLDNDYYKGLLIGWRSEKLTTAATAEKTLYQWIRPDRTMMLNSDMCLAKAINPDPTDGSPTPNCAPTLTRACPNAATRSIVQEFADNNELWLNEFKGIMTKMAAICPADETCSLVDVVNSATKRDADLESLNDFIDQVISENF